MGSLPNWRPETPSVALSFLTLPDLPFFWLGELDCPNASTYYKVYLNSIGMST
jgi:hypothetical protein